MRSPSDPTHRTRRSPRTWLLLAAGCLSLTGTIGLLVAPERERGPLHAAALESLRAGRLQEALDRLGRPPSAAGAQPSSAEDRRAWQEAWSGLAATIGPALDERDLRAAVDLAVRALASGADLVEPPHVIAARLRHAFLVREGAAGPFDRLGDLFFAHVFERDPEMAWEAVAAAALAGRWPDAASYYLVARTRGDPPSARADLRCWPDPRLARDALWGLRIADALRRTAPDLPEEIGRGIDGAYATILRSMADLAAAGDPEHRSLGFFLAGARSLIEGDTEEALAFLTRSLREAGSYYEGAEDPDYLPPDRAGLEISLLTAEALAKEAGRTGVSRALAGLPPSIRRARLVELWLLAARAGLPDSVGQAAAILGRDAGDDGATDLVLLLRKALGGEVGLAARIRQAIERIPGLPKDLTAGAILDGERIRPFADEDLPAAAIRMGRLCEDLGTPEIAGPMIARLEGIRGASDGDAEAIRLYIEGLSLAAREDTEAAAAMLRRLLDLRALRGGLPRGLDARDIAERLAALESRRERDGAARGMRNRARRLLDWIIQVASQRDEAEGLLAVAHADLWALCEGENCDAERAAAAFVSIPTPTARDDKAWLEFARKLEESIAEAEARGTPGDGETAIRALRRVCGDEAGSRFLLEEGRILRAQALLAPREEHLRAQATSLWSRAARAFDRHAQIPSNGQFSFDAGEAHFLAGEFGAAAASFGEYVAGEALRRREDANRTDSADHRLFTSQMLLALSLLRDGRPGEAIDTIEALSPDAQGVVGRTALYARGMAELALGAPERASSAFRRIVVEEEEERSPRWRRSQLRLGAIALSRATALDRDPAAPAAVRREAYGAARIPALRVLQVLGGAEDPPLAVLAGVAGLPEDADGRTPTGLACALQLGESAEGLARVDPERRASWLQEAEKWFGEAAARYERAEREEPSLDLRPPAWIAVRAILGAADAAFERGDAQAARAAYERARARGLGGAQELWALCRLGECARALGLPEAARRYFEGGARLLASGEIGGMDLALLPGPEVQADRARFWQERIAAGLAALP